MVMVLVVVLQPHSTSAVVVVVVVIVPVVGGSRKRVCIGEDRPQSHSLTGNRHWHACANAQGTRHRWSWTVAGRRCLLIIYLGFITLLDCNLLPPLSAAPQLRKQNVVPLS